MKPGCYAQPLSEGLGEVYRADRLVFIQSTSQEQSIRHFGDWFEDDLTTV